MNRHTRRAMAKLGARTPDDFKSIEKALTRQFRRPWYVNLPLNLLAFAKRLLATLTGKRVKNNDY